MMAKKQKEEDILAARFEALMARHGGYVGPKDIVDEARDPSSPFHKYFDWDDAEAAEQWRLAQAASLIRRWKGSFMRIDQEAKQIKIETVRRVQSPQGQRSKGGSSYQTIEEIMADPAKRADMVLTVLKELQAYRKRYAQLTALAEIWDAIDAAIDLHEPDKAAPKKSKDDRPTA